MLQNHRREVYDNLFPRKCYRHRCHVYSLCFACNDIKVSKEHRSLVIVMRLSLNNNYEHYSVNVVGYDYTGYGVSSGMPTEKQTYHDIQAVYKWYVTSRP